jgi:hypothetical protein
MLTIDRTVEKMMCLAVAMRPEELAPNGQENLARGLRWVSQNERFALKGLAQKRTRRVVTWRSK